MFVELSTAELIEAAYLVTANSDRLFEHWLTATFAVIVASHFIGSQMSKYLFSLIQIIYSLFSFYILIRWVNSGYTGAGFINALNERGYEFASGPLYGAMLPALAAIFFIATLGTLHFVWINYKKHEK
jgi:hypothetical protein